MQRAETDVEYISLVQTLGGILALTNRETFSAAAAAAAIASRRCAT